MFYIRRNFMGLQGLAEVAQPGRRGAGPVATWIQVLGSPRLPFPRDVTPSRAQPLGISQGQGQTQGQPARQGVSSTTPRSSSQPSGARSPLTGPHRLVSRLLSLMDATSRPSLGGVAVRAGFICPSLAVSSAFRLMGWGGPVPHPSCLTLYSVGSKDCWRPDVSWNTQGLESSLQPSTSFPSTYLCNKHLRVPAACPLPRRRGCARAQKAACPAPWGCPPAPPAQAVPGTASLTTERHTSSVLALVFY